MILWFLNLFPQFRDVNVRLGKAWRETAAARDGQEKAELELDFQVSVNVALHETNIALQGELKAVKIIADGFSQRATGRKLFAEGPQLPEAPPDPKPMRTGKVQMSRVAAQASQQFYKDLQNRRTQASEPVVSPV